MHDHGHSIGHRSLEWHSYTQVLVKQIKIQLILSNDTLNYFKLGSQILNRIYPKCASKSFLIKHHLLIFLLLFIYDYYNLDFYEKLV